ncbi:MAG: 4Fe-4S binding protein [Thermodesulfobacteriota bacterium]
MDSVYKNLAMHLDNLPGGFPATESGAEIRILKRLFTPQEAEVALHLSMMLEPASAVAERVGMPEDEISKLLDVMSKKGLIMRSRKGGQPVYMAAQFVVGIWEYHVNDLDKGLIQDFNEYVPHLMNTQLKLKTQQLRVIPVSASMSAEMNIMPYEKAEEIVKSQSKIIVAPCICRKEHKMVGKGCDKPEETCLIFGGGAYYYEENGIGRAITQEEALSILRSGVEAGLVLQPGNSKKPLNICMCCGCCCQILKNLRSLAEPAKYACTSYRAEVDSDSCTACEICVGYCQMDAITVDGTARVDPRRCIGCGLCVAACEFGTIRLLEKDETGKWVPPANIVETYISIARERGKI